MNLKYLIIGALIIFLLMGGAHCGVNLKIDIKSKSNTEKKK